MEFNLETSNIIGNNLQLKKNNNELNAINDDLLDIF